MPAYVLCSSVGIALTIVDIRLKRLPYAMTSGLYVACGVAFIVTALIDREAISLLRAITGSAVALAALLLMALVFPGQLGLGDVLLFGWVVFSLAWFGWHSAAVGVLAGLAGQAILGVVARIRRGPGAKLPMGPALLAGWLVSVLIAG